jgi:chitodextrinase
MSANRIKRALAHIALIAMIATLAGVTAAQAAVPPVKLFLSSHFGREVNLTEVGAKGGPSLEDVCTVQSKDECQPGNASSIPGGFNFPSSVAVDNAVTKPSYGNIYVADLFNQRMDELTPSGEFVLMFGKEVNETKDNTSGATKSEKNVCTAASGDVCKAGVEGSEAGAFFFGPQAVAVDPSTGNVYAADPLNSRVAEYTESGQFVLLIGKEVNETKDNLLGSTEAERNLCTAASGDVCTEGKRAPSGSTEQGAFDFENFIGNMLVAGGPEHLLYAGDKQRVQEFKANGEWMREISSEPGNNVEALTLEQQTGDVYLVRPLPSGNLVREFDFEGKELRSFPVSPPKTSRASSHVKAMALDSEGRLAVAFEEGQSFGALYIASSGRRITGFAVPVGAELKGISLNGAGDLYAANPNQQEVLAYTAKPIAELVVGPAACEAGAESDTSATFDCTLSGEVNPEGVSETEALFEWGRTPALGEKTVSQNVEEPKTVRDVVSLRPNETFYYQLAGYDHNVKPPEERFTSEEASLTTPTVAARIIGAPEASFVKTSSVVMFGELNPENASSEYFFEYAAGEGALAKCPGVRKASCPGVASTGIAHSVVYGKIGATFEVTGLQPGTVYHYRLFAEDENRSQTERFATTGPEGSFTTAPAPLPSAETGAYSAVTATGAVISGMVNPDGLPANYAFELGVYNGAGTQYTTVFSGSAGSSRAPVEEALTLTGLQPGTTYAYRITVSSGYIPNESHTLLGAPVTFTTAGIQAVLPSPSPLPLLAVPPIAFPTEPKGAVQCKRGYTRDKHNKCVRQKRKSKTRKLSRRGMRKSK